MTRTVLLLSALALVAGCKKKIDSAKGEKLIGEKFAAAGVKLNISCPPDVTIKKDDKFTCDAKGDDGEFKIEVTMIDDEGNVNWKPVGSLVDTKPIVDEAHKKAGDKVKISCPKRLVILNKKGDTTSCDITDGEKKAKFIITLDDPEKVTVNTEVKE